MQGKGMPLPLHSIPNNNKKNQQQKSTTKSKVIYTEDYAKPCTLTNVPVQYMLPAQVGRVNKSAHV